METSAILLRVTVARSLGDQIMGHSRGRWSKKFLNLTQKHNRHTLTGYSIIVNGSGKKFSEQFMIQKK